MIESFPNCSRNIIEWSTTISLILIGNLRWPPPRTKFNMGQFRGNAANRFLWSYSAISKYTFHGKIF